MRTCLTLILLTGLILLASAVDGLLINEDIATVLEEMQTANYFAFAMLTKMVQDMIPRNITFLMPNDRMLSNVSVPENAVSEFLMRHSIPLPLLFDDLEKFPTGSIIPTYDPDFMLRVSNGGRRRFFLNDIRVSSPNICTYGSSFRCLGIDGVLSMTAPAPPLHCSIASPPPTAVVPASPSPPPSPITPPDGDISPGPHPSGSSDVLHVGPFWVIISFFMLFLVLSPWKL